MEKPESLHTRIAARTTLGTVAVFCILAAALAAAAGLDNPLRWLVLAPLVLAQGLWLDRMYIVAHEGVHRKLFPVSPILNEIAATLLLLPIMAPLTVYRKIHYFHHGSNRRDPLTAALDIFRVRGEPTPLERFYYHAVWIFYVYCGGFFLHSLVTILLFLLLPTSVLKRINPVFNGWKPRARLRSWGEMATGIGFHLAVWYGLGPTVWTFALGLPLVAFAWIWSLLLYIYHYDTTVGPEVRLNVRSLPRHRFLSWVFLNFNEHATHHYDPRIPWYMLPDKSAEVPAGFDHNDNVNSVWEAIWQQRRGPRLHTVGVEENR
jgi:fatty acid desaturase